MEDIKTVPSDKDLERTVLGTLLMYSESFHIVNDILTDDCFFYTENQYVYKSIRKLNEASKPVDILTVTDFLRKKKQLDLIGGPAEIAKLTNLVSGAFNISEHCYILREKAIKRHQIAIGSLLLQKGYDHSIDALETNDWAAEEVFKMAMLTNLSNEQTNEEVAEEIINDIHKSINNTGINGLKTGFSQQDEVLGGYQAPNLVVWAARPGMGKTAKMLCEAYYIAVVLEQPVLIFSMEMSRKELFKRMATIHSKVGSWIYRQKSLNKDITSHFETKIMELATKNIIIDDTPAITPEQMKNKAKKEIVKRGVKIVFADYLQLMTGKGLEGAAEISYCSRKSKAMAKELDIPVVMLAQINREVMKRGGDKEPQLSDLKGSGSIEEDADIVGFVHRPPYFGESNDKKEAYFIISKHRNGPLARIESRYLHDRMQFVDPGEDVIKFEEKPKQDGTPF